MGIKSQTDLFLRIASMPALFMFVLLGCGANRCAAQNEAVSEAMEALQHGDFASAEQVLRAELKAQPNDPEALGVLAVVLDQEKKYGDADAVYARALAQSPHSTHLLNNFGNHLLATGRLKEARAAFLQVLALNSAEVNACVQLASIAAKPKSPAETACLANLPETPQQMLDPKVSFSLGIALAGAREYGKAENYLAHTVQAEPENFQALYDLGLAAFRAGHKNRARDALTQALGKQPENVDVLYDLAAVDAELGQREPALELLVRAARLAPSRADVQRLIAYTSAGLGDFADAAEAWTRYLKLVPGDDVGRREHAFAEAAFGAEANAGMADLQSYVRAHPNDPIGHYELGTAESASNPDQALTELDRALALKPDLATAHIARGLVNYRKGKPAAALPDFEVAAQREPTNPRILDRLGETYTALNRPADALRVFRKAADLAPRDSSILLHLGRALTKAGETEEAKAVFTRFRELGPNKSALPHPAGLVDFLSLSPEEQYARYRAGVERTVRENPDNAEAEVQYLGLMLDDGKTGEAETVARKILALKPSPALLEEAADELLAAEQYSMARDFVTEAAALPGASTDLKLDLALVTFHIEGAQAAIRQMDQIPQGERNGDYYLARMQVLEALQAPEQAAEAFRRAVAERPTHPELYRQVALFLIRSRQAGNATRLLDLGGRVLPNDADIPLLRAVATESGANTGDSELLNEFAGRWPESYKVWSQGR